MKATEFEKKSPNFIWIYLVVSNKKIERYFQILVAISQYLHFTTKRKQKPSL